MKLSNLLKAAALAGIVSAVLNTIVFYIARAANAVNDGIIIRDGRPLMLAPVIISSIVPAFVAALLLFVLGRFTKNALTIFTVVALLFLAVSMMGPFGMPDLPTGMRITLAVMHIVPAVVILYFLRRAAGSPSPANTVVA